jgi:hypothetical protein
LLDCREGIFELAPTARRAIIEEQAGRFVIIVRWFENERLTRRGHLVSLIRNSLKNPEFALPALQDVIDSLQAWWWLGARTFPNITG